MSEFDGDVGHKEMSLISTLCGCSDGFMNFIIAGDGSFNSGKTRISHLVKDHQPPIDGSRQRKVAGLCGFNKFDDAQQIPVPSRHARSPYAPYHRGPTHDTNKSTTSDQQSCPSLLPLIILAGFPTTRKAMPESAVSSLETPTPDPSVSMNSNFERLRFISIMAIHDRP
jgi:hypothetical protein